MNYVMNTGAACADAEDAWSPEDPVEEMLRVRREEAGCPLQTWLVPVVDGFERCLRERFLPRILGEVNARLACGDLGRLLGLPVVPRPLSLQDLEAGVVTCWRLNRTDFLADIDLTAFLAVKKNGQEVPGHFSFCMTLWFCSEDGFSFEVQEWHRPEDRPDRSFWKLDRFLVPVLRDDEMESGADQLWASFLPEARDPGERTARMLAEKLGLQVCEARLSGQNRVRSVLFFREGTVSVQEESRPGEAGVPQPVNRTMPARTILLNTAARSESRDLDILHECIHYEWHLLFYRLQNLISTNPAEIRCRSVQSTAGRPSADPLRWMEYQARYGSLALILPQNLMRGKAWCLYRQSASLPSVNGYYNHPGFRWDRVIRRLANEYSVPRTTVRRRLVQLGHTAALGAVNYVDGGYITPFAFTSEHSAGGRATFVIGRAAMADLYHRSREFRELMGRGDFVYADGHVCVNDPRFLRPTADGARLTPWANAHADACCLRFEKVWLRENDTSVWLFGTLNSCEDYVREYDRFLDRRMTLTARERMNRRNRLMQSMPADFSDALVYLMENRDEGRVTLDELAERAHVSRKTVSRYRSGRQSALNPDVVVALCIALHLPPWLSRLMLDKAGFSVHSYGPRGYYGEILDCCFMDTVAEVQEYLRSAGYPELKLQDS